MEDSEDSFCPYMFGVKQHYMKLEMLCFVAVFVCLCCFCLFKKKIERNSLKFILHLKITL